MPSSKRISLTSIGSSGDRYRFDVTQFTNLHITMPRDENSRRRSRLPVIFLAEFIRGPPLFQTVARFQTLARVKGIGLGLRNHYAKTLWQLLGRRVIPKRDPAMRGSRLQGPSHLSAKNGKPTTSCGPLRYARSEEHTPEL